MSVILASIILWALVLFAAWFVEGTDSALGHGPLPSALNGLAAYLRTLLVAVFGILVGGAMIVGVRGSAQYGERYSWLIYVFVVMPLLILLFIPLERFNGGTFLGMPSFLVGIPGRMVIATALGSVLLGTLGMRVLLKAPPDEGAARALTQRSNAGAASREAAPGRFTGLAWRALSFMQEEAKRFEQSNMGTEHLLLGVLSDTRSQAARIVIDLGADPASIRREVENIISRRGPLFGGKASMTQRCQRVVERAVRIARNSGVRTVGTGHLLLALVENPEDVAGQLLDSSGITADRVASVMRGMPAESDD
ncbi:MAG: hypothetical protein OXE50_02995 [Chloroflexi bacterium]|nr:hypothetical protein [Chloroflexota bacterium]